LAQAVHDARQQAATLTALIHLLDSGRRDVGSDTLHYLNRSAARLSELLEHILDRSAIHENLVVWEVVEDIVESARLTSGVDLDLEIDTSVRVRANASLVRRATSNLLDNACRAAGDAGRVRFAIRHAREAAELVVEDSGPGFGTSLHGRASLGLSVVAELVGNVHGSFEIRRSGDLGGTLLRITVPDRSVEWTEGVSAP
jgi:signal transduction histidine kinase